MADPRQVIAVQRDIERAEGHADVLIPADGLVQACRDEIAARADAHQSEGGGVRVPLDDLVRDARDGAADIVLGQDDRQLRTPFPASQDRSLKVDACTVSICVPSSRSWP